MFLIDDEYAEVVYDFEGEALVVDGLHYLAADGAAELIPLLDDAKLPEDLLGPVLDIVGVVVQQRQEHLLNEQLEVLLPDRCVLDDGVDVLHVCVAQLLH